MYCDYIMNKIENLCLIPLSLSKIAEFDKFESALYYLDVDKFQQLLLDRRNRDILINGVNSFGLNILNILCSHNHPTNLSYTNKTELYHKVIQLYLLYVDKETFTKTLEIMHEKETNHNENLIKLLLNDLSDRPFITVALINKGLRTNFTLISHIIPADFLNMDC
eukprot:Pompholyxophrys_sp_v1_NODE_69_length_2496_cov_1.709136.p3 type:complete len:165 gc:universal NODE_69_length_2496_cov_1.709136:852-358(-)